MNTHYATPLPNDLIAVWISECKACGCPLGMGIC